MSNGNMQQTQNPFNFFGLKSRTEVFFQYHQTVQYKVGMQFLYSAVNGGDNVPIKGKISKWRHLESLIVQLILLGLVFFLIMQNGGLRKSMNQKLSHELMEDLFHDKVSLLSKEIEQTKLTILESNRKSILHTEEVKKLIRVLAREIGLPLPDDLKEAEEELRDPVRRENETYEMIEEDEDESEQESADDSQENSYQDDEDAKMFEQDESSEIREEDEQDEEQKLNKKERKGKCASHEYFMEVNQNQSDQGEAYQNNQEENQLQILETDQENIIFNGYLKELKGLLALSGHLVLILLVCVCLFMVVSLANNPKYRSKSEETFEEILNMGNKNKKKQSLNMRKKEFLKQK